MDDTTEVGPGPTDRLIEWTGERCVPWTGDHQVVYEHYHRYLWAQRLVDGRRVLDLASGEGYGSAILAQRAASVVGLEIDEATVQHSRATHKAPNLEFVEGSMLDLSRFPDDSFDVVTCFEALEHVVEHDELVAGVRRVLAPGGLFLTSTPDRLVYTEELHQHNPHHVRELSYEEFQELLRRFFPSVAIWGQAVAVGSLLQGVGPHHDGSAQVVALAPSGDGDWNEAPEYRPSYFIAAASTEPLPQLPVQSVLVDTELTLVRSSQRELLETADALDGAKRSLAAAAAAYEGQISKLQAEQAALHAHIAELDRREERARAQLARDAEELATSRARCLKIEARLQERKREAAAHIVRISELEAERDSLGAERDAAIERARHPVRAALAEARLRRRG